MHEQGFEFVSLRNVLEIVVVGNIHLHVFLFSNLINSLHGTRTDMTKRLISMVSELIRFQVSLFDGLIS